MPLKTALIFGLFLGLLIGSAQNDQPSVFDQPAKLAEYQQVQREMATAFKQDDLDLAFKTTSKAIELSPFDPLDHYNHACILARQNKQPEALQFLRKSVELGMLSTDQIEKDPDLDSLRKLKEYRKIVKLASSMVGKPVDRFKQGLTAFLVQDKSAEVTETNTAWDARQANFFTRFTLPEKTDHPVISELEEEQSELHTLLKKWYAAGTAAGNHGDLYDNRDRGHSPLNLKKFPQLTKLTYGPEAKARELDSGAQRLFSHQGVVLGNSSTALIHPIFWRSQARSLYTMGGGGVVQLAKQYQRNQLYLYPEHHDHDIGHNGGSDVEGEAKGYGDVFPANTPYVVISQGSSYTDIPFMEAIAATLAAFQPETKQKLIETGGLMAAVQMILRSSNPELSTREDYLTGKAHPTAFNKDQLDPLAMIKKANQIEPDKLPPRVAIKTVREDSSNYQNNVRLFDTPQAIARVFHSHLDSIKMIVTAAQSIDPNGGKLTVHWRVLRGDAKRIKIQQLDANGTTVGISIPFHERAPIAEGSDMASNRVDIGVIVENEHHFSAPAFISVCFPDNQKRVYESDGRILSIDYNHPEMSDNYVDPQLYPSKDWRDEFSYTEDKKLKGWTRIRGEGENQTTEEFTETGQLIVAKDDNGNPTETLPVQYRIEQDENQKPVVRRVELETVEPTHEDKQ